MADEKKNKFIFNLDWVEILHGYPREVRYEVYDAIMEYAQSGILLELKPTAKMAFDFIKREMDYNANRYEEVRSIRQEAGRQGGAPRGNQNARKKLVADDVATKNKQIQAKTTKNKQNNLYVNDNVNVNDNNSLSLSLSPLESRESESGEESGGVSAADRESFFEILFFRNFKNPQKEVERLIDHYSAVGWRRHGDIRAVRDKTALAKGWMPENKEQGIGRFQPDVLAKLQATYAEIKAESPEDASTIIHETIRFEDGGDFRIICSMAAMEAYNRHWKIFNKINFTNGKQGRYSIPKK